MPAPGVLVVDDDPGIRELLTSALGFAGYDVTAVGTVAAALTALRETRPAIVVLDVVLPDADGLDMLRVVRGAGDTTPVVLLSSRDAVADRVAGLGVGADDYVTKPFDLSEVVARLAAVLRRTDPGVRDDGTLRYADLVVDPARATARRGSRPLDLSPAEFRLLAALAASPERVLSKTQLLERVWGYDVGDTAVVEKLVSRLRRKLDAEPPALLATVRGFGYALRLGGSAPSDDA